MTGAQSMRAALRCFAIVVLVLALLSLSGCDFDPQRWCWAAVAVVLWSLIALFTVVPALMIVVSLLLLAAEQVRDWWRS